MTAQTNAATQIADAYRYNLACEVGDALLDQIDRDNRAHASYEHAHDHCDANALMSEAFRFVAGRAPDVTRSADAELLHAAWEEARRLSVDVPRRYMITSASIELTDGAGDGAYDLLGVASTDAAAIGSAIAEAIATGGLTSTDDYDTMYLNVRIRIDRRKETP